MLSTEEIKALRDTKPNRGRIAAALRFGTPAERAAATAKTREWKMAADEIPPAGNVA